MATYAIGDIQGCCEELKQLVDDIAFTPGTDRIWFVGDLVNRGPQSLEALRFIKGLGSQATVVLGNHDLHLLAISEGCAKSSKGDTLDAVLAAPDRKELLQWLRRQPLLHREGGHVLVHAGLLPGWTAAAAANLAAEVETELRGPRYKEFLSHLYGSKPDQWSDDLQGADRWRVIVNAMTRMRFASAEGVMELQSKGEEPPPGFLPWFDVPGRKSADHVIVCGHWSALGLKIEPNLHCIDSGCVWGGELTAIRLEDRQIFQVACRSPQAREQ